MKLSLREARKLETRIQAKVNEGIINGRAINIHESLLDKDEETECWLAETFAMGDDSVTDTLAFVSARADIRREIQATNERVGINALVAQRKELISLRSVWGDVVSGYDVNNGHAMTEDVLRRQASTAVASAQTTAQTRSTLYGGNGNTITVATISDELHESAVAKTRQLLRDIDVVEDKLSSLNATTKIELEGTLVTFLEEQDLL